MAQSLTVGGDQHEKVGMKTTPWRRAAIHIKAGMTLVVEAGVQMSLKVGGNFIDISPAGVAIQGVPMVLINSGGAAGCRGRGASRRRAGGRQGGEADQAGRWPTTPSRGRSRPRRRGRR